MNTVRRNVLSLLLAGFLLLLVVSPVAAEGGTIQASQNATFGTILTDSAGKTLYRFTKDTPNVSSACYDKCATTWPPLLITAGNPVAGTGIDGNLLGVLTRKDGTRQVMYNGMPLYYFDKDAAVGDSNGQRLGNVWFIVHPNTVTVGNQGVMTQVRQHPSLGPIMTDAEGRTLYWFTKDKGTISVCYDRCAATWPPLLVGASEPQLATGVAGQLTTSLRDDGERQVAYEGRLLYYFTPDTTIGDTKGQGVGNVWFVVPPVAAAAPAPTAAPAPAPAAPTSAPPAAPQPPAPPSTPGSLPNTGSDSTSGGLLAALALVLISCGGMIVAARRRTS